MNFQKKDNRDLIWIYILLLFCTIFIPSVYAWDEILGENLTSHYKLDQTSGVVIDSKDGNNGTNNGATRGISGILDNSFSFDGTDDSVDLFHLDSGQMTVNLWIKGWTATDDSTIIAKWDADALNNGNWIFWFDGEVLKLLVREASAWKTVTATIPDSANWNMITWTYDGVDLKIYVNAGTPSSLSWSGAIDDNSDDINLGVNYKPTTGGNRWYYDGLIDEVSIFNKSINSTQISYLYNSGNSRIYEKEGAITQLVEVNITSPEDSSNSSSLTINFSYIPTISFAIDKAELWIAKLIDIIDFGIGVKMQTFSGSSIRSGIRLIDSNDTGSEKDLFVPQLGNGVGNNVGGIWYCEGNNSQSTYFNTCERIIFINEGAANYGANSVEIVDLDNDGYLDAVAGAETTYIAVAYGNASNSPPFNAQINSSSITSMETDYLTVGHSSSESLYDIFILTEDPTLYHFIANNSKTGFKYDTAVSLGNLAGSDSAGIVAGYVSNSSRVDVFPLVETGNIFRCGYNNSQGDNYDTCTIIAQYKYDLTTLSQSGCFGESTGYKITNKSMDINGDNIPDILTAAGNETFMVISNSSEDDWYNNKTILEEDWASVDCLYATQLMDYNKDGVMDWLSTDKNNGNMWIWFGNQSEADYFNDAVQINITNAVNDSFIIEDITGNGIYDMVTGGIKGSGIFDLWFYTGESSYENWTNVTQNSSTIINTTINNFTYTFDDYGDYIWNVKVYDNTSLSGFSSANFSINIYQESSTTCTCPGLTSNWEISLADYCNITTNCNLSTGNITFINNGSVLFNATLTANKITWKDSVGVIEKYNLGNIFRGWIV